ncbi:MAG: hypothetical protein HY785_25450 [Oscillatoriophycideae cyanobacterium NC_groundwater_1537_Pr4_S-0.65um_50_18]|nr:hypothetical protein [Oscillatoriophycideae cyanobacterium NC_groundwater_1537_Pr4_S-0.65um_50_18]
MRPVWKIRVLGAIAGISSLWLSGAVQAAPSHPIRQGITCPDQLTDLMPLLLRDLPSYANRVNQNAYALDGVSDTPGYVLVAGPPDYRALRLDSERLPAVALPDDRSSSSPPQIFFTTLERQYVSGQAVKLQHYHWLFLTQTEGYGWQLVLLFSAIGEYPVQQLTSAPQDANQGVIAQAIRLWLRDCQAGAVEGNP